MQYLIDIHLKYGKWIVHYIKGTYQLGIKYYHSPNPLAGYIDSDQEGNGDDKKSTLAMYFD